MDRQITSQQTDLIRAALSGPGKVAVFSTNDDERLSLASRLAGAFSVAGLTVLTGPHTSADFPDVNLTSQVDGPRGIFVLVYVGGDGISPLEQAEIDRIVGALMHAGIDCQELRSNGSGSTGLKGSLYSLYYDPINTSVPIVFVGAKPLA